MAKLKRNKKILCDSVSGEFREVFEKYNFTEQELKELKKHFEQMAGILVDFWLNRKKYK